jgi:hypothetical protein
MFQNIVLELRSLRFRVSVFLLPPPAYEDCCTAGVQTRRGQPGSSKRISLLCNKPTTAQPANLLLNKVQYTAWLFAKQSIASWLAIRTIKESNEDKVLRIQ